MRCDKWTHHMAFDLGSEILMPLVLMSRQETDYLHADENSTLGEA